MWFVSVGSLRRSLLLSPFCLLFLTGPAVAESESSSGVRLRYEAPSRCPGRQDFEARLAQRGVTVVKDRKAPLAVISIEPAPTGLTQGAAPDDAEASQTGFNGEVRLVLGREEKRRKYSTRRCSGLVEALAVFVALSVADKEPSDSAARVAPPPPSTVDEAAIDDAVPPSRFAWKAFAGVGLRGGISPVAAASTLLGVEAALTGLGGPSLWIALGASGSADVPFGPGQAAYRLLFARLGLCESEWLRVGQTSLGTCALAELGSHFAGLSGVSAGKSVTKAWQAFGAAAVLRVALNAKWSLESSWGILVPTQRYDFRSDTGLLFSTPLLAPLVELSAVLTF